ncbi:MAG: hypothetical protein HY361_03355 [Candidatus Aenigmarchaeota archaeon]|nr:hypothetical protein [Candidatus Aenigmarchaeota archaeon]
MNKMLIVIIALLIISFLLFSFFRKPRSTELGNLTFEELCKNNGDQWMEMEETRKGKPTSTSMCSGCMIADNHFCDVDEYIEYVKKLPDFVR